MPTQRKDGIPWEDRSTKDEGGNPIPQSRAHLSARAVYSEEGIPEDDLELEGLDEGQTLKEFFAEFYDR